MTKRKCIGWINNTIGSPKIQGSLEISKSRAGIFIGGDPSALRSLAKLLIWLANVDQESLPGQPDGERCHVHLHTRGIEGNILTPFSEDTELCRLDAKGTGDFPEKYQTLGKGEAAGKTIKASKKKNGVLRSRASSTSSGPSKSKSPSRYPKRGNKR